MELPKFRPDPQTMRFVERVVSPNGLYYLSDEQVTQLRQRLTRDGMAQQLERDAAMLAAPGPAAGGLAKALARDPLRLHEFLADRLNELARPLGSVDLTSSATGGAFLSADHRSLLIRVTGLRSAGDFVFARQVTQTIARLIDQANTDHLRIDVTGAYAMSAHSAAMIQNDSMQDIVSTVLGLAVLFVIASRRPIRLFTFAFVPVLIGMIWGFGIYAACMHTITPLAAVVGGTLGAIGLDYTTHYITHYQDLRPTSPSTMAAVLKTSHQIFWPSLAAWVTSVIGFAAVGVSPVRVLRDFSILGTLSLIGAWLGTLLVLPAMLAWLSPSDASPFTGRFHNDGAIFRWIARNSRLLVTIATLIVVGLIAATFVHGVHVEIESDPMILHPRPSPPLEAQRRIAEKMQSGAGTILVHLQAADSRQLLIRANMVHERLRGVADVFGLDSLLPDPRVTVDRSRAFDAAFADRTVSDFRQVIAQSDFRPDAYTGYAEFLKRLASPGPPPGVDALAEYPELAQLLLPREPLAGSPTAEAISLIFPNKPLETRDDRERLLTAARDALAGIDGATVTGTVAIGHDLEHAVQRDLPRFVAIALVCIAVYLLIHFRAIGSSLLALLPIAISLVFVIACFCLAGTKLNLLHTVMAPLLLGINLDYGIFAVHAWHESHSREQMAHHFTPAFAGLMLCGGSTVIGFGSLIITSVPAVKSLGWLVNVGVISCVAGTLLVQWPVMLLMRRSRAESLAS
jgi:predicted RND superfamily exporter protein